MIIPHTQSKSPHTPTAPTEGFQDSLRASVALCVEIRDAVVSILRKEASNPVWADFEERFGEQTQELEQLLETHATLESFISNELPYQIKVALADLQTHKDRPKGALLRLLAETIQVAGPTVME